MRIFGKMSHFLQISRCLSYHAPICRPHRLLHGSCKQWKKICSNCVCWQPPLLMEIQPHMPAMRIHVQLFSTRTTNVFTFNSTSDMLRKRISFSGTQGETSEAGACIVPVGIIVPDKSQSNMKIVIVPLDLVNQDSESLKNTLNVINELRNHAKEIDIFTNSIIEDFQKDNAAKKEEIAATEEQEQITKMEDIHLWDTYTEKEVHAIAKAARNEPSSTELELQAAVASLATELAPSTQADVAPMIPSPCTPNLPNAPPAIPVNPNTVPNTTPQTQPGVMPLADPMEPQISAAPQKADTTPEAVAEPEAEIEPEVQEVAQAPAEAPAQAEVHQITINVPDQLGQALAEMAISSMQLSFEMNMTNVRDAILYGENASMNETQNLSDEPMMFLETHVKVDPAHEPEITVPLHFNALIKGIVDIDAVKLNPEQLTNENLPDYNDAVTSIAASICSTALQKGFSPELSNESTNTSDYHRSPLKSSAQARMALKRHQAQKHMKVEYTRPTAMMASAPMPQPLGPTLKDGCKNPIIKKKKKCPKPCKLDDPCKEDKCNRPQKPSQKKRKPKSQNNQVELTASAGKKGAKDPCAKGKGDQAKDSEGGEEGGQKNEHDKGDRKKDPCAKGGKDGKGGGEEGGQKNEHDKGDRKKNFCAKGGKDGKGGCEEGGQKNEHDKGDRKKDPCAKGGKGGKDGKDKKDPCAKFKKGKDGKGGCEEGGQKNEHDKGDRKKNFCAKGGKDGKGGCEEGGQKNEHDKGDRKKNFCAKGGKGGKDGKDKKDPCAKFKKGKDGKGGCEEGGQKNEHDKGDRKKNFCAKGGKDGKGGCEEGGQKNEHDKGDRKKDPCAKFKKSKDGKGGKDKKDPCAKFKKGKDDKGKHGKGDRKKDSCAKFKKGKDGKGGKDKKDPCAKFKKGKDDKGKHGKGDRKKDPCAKFKKGKDGKGGAGKKDPCKKKYSTFSSPVSKFYHSNRSLWHPKRQLSTTFSEQAQSFTKVESHRQKPASFTVYSTLVRRHYGGKPSKMQMSAWGLKAWVPQTQSQRTKKDEAKTSKCNALQPNHPKRKHQKPRDGLRTDCYGSYPDECPKASCGKSCDRVTFPRKKCEKKKNKPVMAKKASKPKKKLPAICNLGKKGKDVKGRKK
ncbi:hypothetical protein ACLKA7_010382 [Drosophila subpalustris]